ncbi:MAG: 3'-5' exonuclease [Clostridia bacterium]|nr:3'-5' exonuclease [Clostridia bacterium]
MEANKNRIVAIDVETPNGRDAAICQIGIVEAEFGEIIRTESILVDPEVPFDPINISIHGITPADVKNAPNFPQLWPRIAGYFSDSVIVAHNAAFDLGMITAVLARYGIPVPPITYCCTVQMARRRFSRETYGSYRLDTLCAAFDIRLDHHHDALSDATACYRLYRELLADYGEDPRDVRPYKKTVKPAQAPVGTFSTETAENAELRNLRALLDGVEPVTFLNPGDSMAIAHWMDRHVELSGEPPFDTIFLYLYRMISDKPLTASEAEDLKRLLRERS